MYHILGNYSPSIDNRYNFHAALFRWKAFRILLITPLLPWFIFWIPKLLLDLQNLLMISYQTSIPFTFLLWASKIRPYFFYTLHKSQVWWKQFWFDLYVLHPCMIYIVLSVMCEPTGCNKDVTKVHNVSKQKFFEKGKVWTLFSLSDIWNSLTR